MSDDTNHFEPNGDAPNPWLPPPPSGSSAQPASEPPVQPPVEPSFQSPGQPYLGGDILGATATKRRSWLMPVLGGVAVAAVLLGSVVGVKVYRSLSGGGAQPEKWAPASSFAFAKVDLDPPAGAKVAAYQFSQKFPSVPRATDADSLHDTLLGSLFADSPVEYTQDIKPWAGNRLAVAAFNGADGTPQVVFIVSVKDSAKAERALAQLQADDPTGLDIDVESDFILISPTPGGAHAAADLAKSGSLADAGMYGSDIGLLHKDRIITAWFDVDKLMSTIGDLASSVDGMDGDAASLSPLVDMFGAPGALAGASGLSLGKGGRAVASVRVASDFIELEARAIGLADTVTAGEAGEMLGNLGAGTVAALAVSHPDELITKALDQLSADGGIGPYVQDGLDELSAMTGVTIPDDITNLLGSAWVLSLDALPSDDSAPAITSRSRPGDLDKARSTASKLLNSLEAQEGDSSDVRGDGKDLVVSFGNAPASAGKLADSAAYKKAMGSLPPRVQMAAYVNLTPIWDVALRGDDESKDARVLKAAGVVVGADSASSVVAPAPGRRRVRRHARVGAASR